MQPSQDVILEYISRPVKEPYAAGEIVLKTDQSQRSGRCFYTDFIDTGLGAGRHALRFDLIDELGVDGGPIPQERILIGDPQVFSQSSYIPAVPQVRLGAFLDPKSGAFQLGIQLENAMQPGQLKIAWQARKEELLSKKEQEIAKAQSFYIANPPKYLRPGMKFTFSCFKADNLQGEVRWKVVGEDAGSITRFGGYTAPQRQGVFEVQAYLEGTDLQTSVYVVIKE